MKGITIIILLITFGYVIYFKYIRPKDTRKLSFLDDTHWMETTVDHYYSGLEYVVLFTGLFFAFIIEMVSFF